MRVLVLAGSFDQIELIKQLKSNNCFVILVDYLEEPLAKEYADVHYRESTLDIEKVYEIAKNESVEAIITACTDQALYTMAKVSEQLNLKCYLSEEQALALTNKCKMKQLFSEYNINTSKYQEINDIKNVDLKLKYPIVIKPANCNSSKGVLKLHNQHELEKVFDSVKNLSSTKEVIVEEFIEGIEISIDVFIKDHSVEILLITETLKMDDNERFIIVGSRYPSPNITPKQLNNIKNETAKIVEAFNLFNSPLLIQAIIKGDEVYIIECSARMGGGSKYKLIHHLSSVNVTVK